MSASLSTHHANNSFIFVCCLCLNKLAWHFYICNHCLQNYVSLEVKFNYCNSYRKIYSYNNYHSAKIMILPLKSTIGMIHTLVHTCFNASSRVWSPCYGHMRMAPRVGFAYHVRVQTRLLLPFLTNATCNIFHGR